MLTQTPRAMTCTSACELKEQVEARRESPSLFGAREMTVFCHGRTTPTSSIPVKLPGRVGAERLGTSFQLVVSGTDDGSACLGRR